MSRSSTADHAIDSHAQQREIILALSKQCMGILFVNLLMVLGFPGSSIAVVEVYSIDKDPDLSDWAIRHVVSKTFGTFSNLHGKIEFDPEKLLVLKAESIISVYGTVKVLIPFIRTASLEDIRLDESAWRRVGRIRKQLL